MLVKAFVFEQLKPPAIISASHLIEEVPNQSAGFRRRLQQDTAKLSSTESPLIPPRSKD